MSKILIATAVFIAAAHAAAAQPYNAQILLPPSEFSQPVASTNGYAMNESGQVFGEAILNNNGHNDDYRPVLWTDGVGAALPIPNGYYWDSALGYQFVNNSGLVVSRLRIANGVPGLSEDESRVVVWQNGVPQVLPAPDSCTWLGQRWIIPWGLNNQGHVLFTTYGDNACGKVWLWNGSGFQVVLDSPTASTFHFTPARNHLNDADHVAIDRSPNFYPDCDSPGSIAGTVIGTAFTPITVGTALQINNHDQVFLYCTVGGQVFGKLWDGAALIDLGFGGYASMNELGQIVFLAGPATAMTPKIYRDGVISDLILPLFPQTAGFVSGSLINSSGQIVVVESLLEVSFTTQAVLFTPRTPVITWPKPADITYGTALGLTQLYATANVPGTFAYMPAAGTVLHAGPNQTLSLTFTPSDLTHYDPTTASNSINVQPAPLSVMADNATKAFGAPLPSFSASFIGFVNGDGPGNLAGTLTLTTSATFASPTGTYPIVPGGLSSPDYAITFLPGTLTINPASVSLATVAFPDAVGFLQSSTLAVLVGLPNQDPPVDGSVQFKDGDTVLGTSDVMTLNGLAVLQVNGLAPGVHAITAHYSGSTNFLPVSSSPFTLTVQPIAASTFTLLIPLTNPRLAGQPAVFAALVVPFGGGTPTGTVRFTEGNTTLGNVPLTGGVALFSTTALATGLHGISASYLGAGGRLPSTSPLQVQTIYTGTPPTSTAVTLASSPNPSTLDQPVTFTATVTGGATTGDVYFLGDGFILGHAPIADTGGAVQAALTVSSLSVGAHIVTALYVGSPGFAASGSILPAVPVVEPAGGADSASAPDAGAQLTRIRSVLSRYRNVQ
jgi:hypothetical protein